MPIKRSAIKALRQTKKRTAANDTTRVNLKALLKQTRRQVRAKSAQGLDELLRNTTQALAKAAKAHIIKPNTASRLTSRLAKSVQSLKKS